MTARPILVAQISDLHIKPRGVLAYRRVDTAAALAACVRAASRRRPTSSSRPAILSTTQALRNTITYVNS